eukprot:g25269.t1
MKTPSLSPLSFQPELTVLHLSTGIAQRDKRTEPGRFERVPTDPRARVWRNCSHRGSDGKAPVRSDNQQNWKDVVKLEKVRKRFTRMLPGLEGLSYRERLNSLGLFSLDRRILRGDPIEVYKIMRGMDR